MDIDWCRELVSLGDYFLFVRNWNVVGRWWTLLMMRNGSVTSEESLSYGKENTLYNPLANIHVALRITGKKQAIDKE